MTNHHGHHPRGHAYEVILNKPDTGETHKRWHGSDHKHAENEFRKVAHNLRDGESAQLLHEGVVIKQRPEPILVVMG